MESEKHDFHVMLFPFMAHGHMIPISDMAKLFASQGVKTTIVTTPLNAPTFSKAAASSATAAAKIEIKTLKFPSLEAGLPEGCENLDTLPKSELGNSFFKASKLLQSPFERLLHELDHKPNCLVADMFFPWATDAAAKFGIPRLVFHGTSVFALSASECVRLYEPYKDTKSDSDTFVIPNLPGDIKMTRAQVPDFIKAKEENDLTLLLKQSKESELRSYGIIINSFYELEPIYADFYRNFLKRKAWHIGPLSLCNRGNEEKGFRGKQASINEHECLNWLDSKKPNSIVYVCFGSVAKFTNSQLKEIAFGLEASGQGFIWVVRKGKDDDDVAGNEDWLPLGFEERMQGKGLIIRGWAPQVLILDHDAVGGFVTHCGWNSTLEGIAAGVPMVTWPVSAEQFYNEKLVTQVLKTGVGVGTQRWVRVVGDSVKKEAIERCVRQIMVGEEAEEMRWRAKGLRDEAKRAVEEGGSSNSDLKALIEELSSQ